MIAAVNEFLDDLRGGRMSDAPIVKVEQGQLQGRVLNTPSGSAYYSFQGIPYAKPPLGSLRFKAPQPPEPWTGVRDATSEGSIPPQFDPIFAKQYIGDENCLFLNVYTPQSTDTLLPVMVYIFGGAFKFGSGNTNMYGPDYLVDEQVVVVTLNYRLGALGFLSLNTPEVPGNAGLKDIVQALRWVKKNIQNFGGDPNDVTVFGESAGGVATAVLTASPLSKNLLNKAIMQSGTALHSYAYQKDPISHARELAKALGSQAEDADDILQFLTTVSAKDIVNATGIVDPIAQLLENGFNKFGLVIEREFACVEAVLTEPFYDLLVSGRVAQIPVMIGHTKVEFAVGGSVNELQKFIPHEFNVKRDSEESLVIAEQLKELYFKHVADDQQEYFELYSHRYMNVDVYRHIKYHNHAVNCPIYYYIFDYFGDLNLSLEYNNIKRAMHTDELGYLFKNELLENVDPNHHDIKTRERMVKLWTNFAKTGNPTSDEHHINLTWKPVSGDVINYLNISRELTLSTNPDKEKMDFWDNLYHKYYKIWNHPNFASEESHRTTREAHIAETLTEAVNINEDDGKTRELEVQMDKFNLLSNDMPTKIHIAAPKIRDDEENGYNKARLYRRPSNEIKVVKLNSNGVGKDVIRANDPPEDDLPKNIGVNKFVNFFESLGRKK